jgi:hypothetical protein
MTLYLTSLSWENWKHSRQAVQDLKTNPARGAIATNLEMRRKLAKLPYEKKIQMAGELIKLARDLKKNAREISWEEFMKSTARKRQRPPRPRLQRKP